MGKSSGKRKRGGGDDVLHAAYEHITIIPRTSSSTDRPGSPHRFFKSSFDVHVNNSPAATSTSSSLPSDNKDEEECCGGTVVVHQHANGLCVVTVGDELKNNSSNPIKEITFQVEEAPTTMSSHARRKRHSKLLSGRRNVENGGSSTQDGCLVRPNTAIAKLVMQSGEILRVPAGVWGTVLELNANLSAKLLMQDPLLDGYLAVIVPIGSFPPRLHNGSDRSNDDNNKKDVRTKLNDGEATCPATT